jgi:hypothetical protein
MAKFVLLFLLTTTLTFQASAAFQCLIVFEKETTLLDFWDLSLPQSPVPVLYTTQVPHQALRVAVGNFPDAMRLDADAVLQLFNRKRQELRINEILDLQIQLQTRALSLQQAEAWSLENGWNPLRARSVEMLSEDFVRRPSDAWHVQKDRSIPANLISQNPFFAYRQGWFNVVIHGSGTSFIVNQRVVTAKVLAQEIKKRNHTNEPINLL